MIDNKMKASDTFNNRVYETVAQIPAGNVATYGQIAAILGSPMAARAVGQAMRCVKGTVLVTHEIRVTRTVPLTHLDIPCHRVVNKSGAMAPGYAFGGIGKQRGLLEAEGVAFKENGCIDMKRHLWRASYSKTKPDT